MWSSIFEYRCSNSNNTRGYETKCALTSVNEYTIIQLKLFTVNNKLGQNNVTKITDLQLYGIPSTTIHISRSSYQPYADIFYKGK